MENNREILINIEIFNMTNLSLFFPGSWYVVIDLFLFYYKEFLFYIVFILSDSYLNNPKDPSSFGAVRNGRPMR